MSCPIGEAVFINVTVTELAHGDALAVTFGGTGPIACAGAAVLTWTIVTAFTNGVAMHDGPAHVVANAFAFAPFEFAVTTAEVHLQG